MADPTPTELTDLTRLADATASEVRDYLSSVTEVATGRMDSTALSVLLLAVSQTSRCTRSVTTVLTVRTHLQSASHCAGSCCKVAGLHACL